MKIIKNKKDTDKFVLVAETEAEYGILKMLADQSLLFGMYLLHQRNGYIPPVLSGENIMVAAIHEALKHTDYKGLAFVNGVKVLPKDVLMAKELTTEEPKPSKKEKERTLFKE